MYPDLVEIPWAYLLIGGGSVATMGLVPALFWRLGWRMVASTIVVGFPLAMVGPELAADPAGYGNRQYEIRVAPLLERMFPEMDFPDRIVP